MEQRGFISIEWTKMLVWRLDYRMTLPKLQKYIHNLFLGNLKLQIIRFQSRQ